MLITRAASLRGHVTCIFGNRSSATSNGLTTTYLANTVNEYTSITGAPAPPMYDANGNAISYPVLPLGSSSLVSCVLNWDINNQLIAATAGADSASYQYDALGRRTKRTETIGGVTTDAWFFTNGWNVELEHNGSAFTRRMTWGLDLSQSPQGAGGVGGLVMSEGLPSGGGAPVPSFPTYDGNGNITAWVNASGTVVARQRYDAYGNIIEQTGTPPSNYGFSTKPQDQVTGLFYYGYRYYDPASGRWPSRDPIEESGGLNLYGFVGNDGVNLVDYLGQVGAGGWVFSYGDWRPAGSGETQWFYSANVVICNGIAFESATTIGIDVGLLVNIPGLGEFIELSLGVSASISVNVQCPEGCSKKCLQARAKIVYDIEKSDFTARYFGTYIPGMKTEMSGTEKRYKNFKIATEVVEVECPKISE